ncbi:T-cell surface protein tactile isoform X1 [Corvus cornix cornix]|uniref:T-cell surface protein tactile isoform X1 n=1 Tax=Corvus cornix cornix TaxID=932674 RepID=UPI000900874F|nr:T-cell surface protein tactile isoform X1 [Corvus cornix cornix]XP_019139313.1 T-cell surface protein tactile isoform X1 [Corvus cornix cornix]XP_019139314.1 T-cell surface protein tactile isoform X1 [Corvus cornix cornix]
MKARWLFSLFCLLSVPSVTGQTADVITQTEVVHALPGADVTLVCMLPKPHTTKVIQTQWSKTNGSLSTKIAVYHPDYGTHYFKFSAAPYNFSVSFSTRRCCRGDDTESLCSTNPNATSDCSWWDLHLKNVTMSLSGQYKCTFATYPYGTKAAKIQLIVKAAEERHYLKKVWLNETLEIPCLEDVTSENLSTYPLKWLVGENGRKEELVTKEPSCPAVYRNSSVLYRQRVLLGFNNALKISSPKITDDGRVFSCHVLYHPERVQKSSTTVRVFAYPEIFISLQEGSASTSQKPSVSCVVRKAFPKPSLLWYMDRVGLMEQPGEISVVQEDWQDNEGFYELRSTLMLQGTHETYKMFSCVCLFPFPWNETRNISSEEIFVSFDNKSNEASAEVFTTTISDEHQTSLASLDFTSQANLAPASTTQAGTLTSTTEAKGYISATAVSETLTTARNLSYSITDRTISATGGKDLFTTSSLLNSTGDKRNTKASRFPWPTVVAVLLLFCSSLVALGIRKWCQYQKEIMNRPPSFKPPPPPIKYTSMVESDGTPPSCHELENL